MSDFLIRHAKKHVWCTPDQDWQLQLKPAKISPKNGARGWIKVVWDEITLPTKQDYYHVYQIGQMDRRRVGADTPKKTWIHLPHHCHHNSLVVDLYCSNGVQYPKCLSYLYVTEDRNIILAVRHESKIPVDLNQDPLYARFYANAYFASDRSDPLYDEIRVVGERVTTSVRNLQLQHEYETYQTKPGTVNAFVNGILVNTLGPTTAQVGDTVEFVYDSTVKLVVDLPINSLETFNSILDVKRKYLLEFGLVDVDTMEYRDDIDVWIVAKESGGKYQGVYYHKNQEDSVRMVTHRDYSIPVQYVSDLTSKHLFLLAMEKCVVRLQIRHSGYDRPIVDEHHRIKELYRLSPSDRTRALLGLDSVVPEWRADQLEFSYYNKIMRSRESEITLPASESAFGYHAIGVLLADTPQHVIQGMDRREVPLAIGLREHSTHYEYDADGLLIDTYQHPVGDKYYPRNVPCTLVESVVGRTGDVLDLTYGNEPLPLQPKVSYRFYRSSMKSGIVMGDWVDVTGDESVYTLVNGNYCVWKHDVTKWYGLIKSDSVNLGYTFTLKRTDGLYDFTLVSKNPLGGIHTNVPIPVPVGKLDLWMNQRALIEGLDYIVHWPRVVITNKIYLNPGDQTIVVRGMGHPDKDLGRQLPKDVGFVDNGELSRNDHFDLRDDRVVRVVVGGAVYRKDEFAYGEDRIPTVSGVVNGTPYAVEELHVPVNPFTVSDTYDLRAIAKGVDQRISEYLTLKLPERPTPTPNFIPERYEIYSPFATKIMYDLLDERIGGGRIRGEYSDQDVVEWLTAYEWLLKFDPTQAKNLPDSNYVVVHPHNLYVETVLDIYQYTFMERVIRLFLNNRVDISSFIRLGLPTP